MKGKPDSGSRQIDAAAKKTLLHVGRIALGASATLAALLAAGTGSPEKYIDAQIGELLIIPESGATCFIAVGRAATTNDAAVPALSFPCNATMALAIQLVGSGYAGVWQFG